MASRLNASYVSILQRTCDVLAIYMGLYVVCKLNSLDLNNHTLLAFLMVVSSFQLIGGLTDFYRSWRGISLLKELISCIKNVTITVFISSIFVLIFSSVSYILFFEYFIFLILFIGILRISIRLLYTLFFNCVKTSERIIVIGDSSKARLLYNDLVKSEWTGSQPLGLFSFSNDQRENYKGNLNDVMKLAKQGVVSKIYIVVNQSNLHEVNDFIEFLSDTTCSTVIVPDLFSYNLLYSRVEDINGIPVIPLFDTRISGINTLLKRIEDIFVSSIILILISPILIVIAIAIKATSSGPVFFKQLRYGLNGKPIKVLKFRTMKVMENGFEVKQAVKDDPRVTKVGKILRRTSLDELPQFINVLLGNMSVVGPRPHAVAHNEEYRKLITGYMLRHKVKPGITGLAQIRGWRGETDTLDKMEKRVECDLEYIRDWSVGLDIKIIFLTIFYGFIHKAAY